MWSAELVARMAAAIDADLERQAGVQRGVEYRPAREDDAGVAGANMNIVVAELARAALSAIADASREGTNNAKA